jgi:hypothetical protein
MPILTSFSIIYNSGMVRINNSFDGVTSSRVLDAYTRNLHDYRIAIEVSSLSIIDYLLSRNENPVVIPAPGFESTRHFLDHLSQTYHKPIVNFICNNDANHPLYRYRQELNLISQLLYQSKKSYVYCLNDVIDFYLDNNLAITDLIIPKNVVYASDMAGKEFHKYLPEGFDKIVTEYKTLESDYLVDKNIQIQDIFNNPQNLYLKLLEEFTEKGINYLVLQLYDFLVEETKNKESPLIIHSNKLINIWDDICFVSQNLKCKPSLDKKINLLPLDKIKLNNKDNIFDYIVEEWSANIARALELEVRIGVDFLNYLNTCNDTKFIDNYVNYVYPNLTALGLFMQRKIGIDSVFRQKRFCF